MSGTKQDYINYRVLKSNELFEDVKLLASNQRWNSCVNRHGETVIPLIEQVRELNNLLSEMIKE